MDQEATRESDARETGSGRGKGRTLVAVQMQVGESAQARGIRESEDQRYGPLISDRVKVEVESRKFRASVPECVCALFYHIIGTPLCVCMSVGEKVRGLLCCILTLVCVDICLCKCTCMCMCMHTHLHTNTYKSMLSSAMNTYTGMTPAARVRSLLARSYTQSESVLCRGMYSIWIAIVHKREEEDTCKEEDTCTMDSDSA